MSIIESHLVNLQVREITKIYDYIQIGFFDDSILTIFNRCRWKGGNLLDIVQKKVKSIEINERIVRIEFTENIILEFDAVPDYDGPEVLTLSRKDQPLVVMN